MPPEPPAADPLHDVTRTLEPAFRLDNLVALSRERALYQAWDRLLKRPVAIRVHLVPGTPGRAWFLRETETLAALDHPSIRHVYAGVDTGVLAYRTTNWIEGESLAEAMARGPRPVPTVMSLIRDLLSALEYAHARGVVFRRIAPTTLLVDLAGRAVVSDLRYCSWCVSHIPADDPGAGGPFSAPEIRAGAPGDPAADVYTVAALVYYALTGQEPPLEPATIVPPRQLRAAVPLAVERVLLRALSARPADRYFTATEMLEDFVIDAGAFQPPAAVPALGEPGFERRLRRALGDDYELLDLIGTGGFGRVYRVRDLQLERLVALKVLHPALIRDPSVVERFRREAQLAARLDHPNIVNIYEIGGRSGLIWYTMELIHGPSVAQMVDREGPLPLDRVLRLLREGLSALAHAHGFGLVHRDIKPENLLIASDGSLQITDFGLALALRQKFGGATSQSGTPQYASPEQLLGERVDQRSDLYSLAAVAYYALLGRAPFPGITPEQVLARQTTDQLPDVERREDVSEAMWEVLDRALRADVEARYASAAEFLQALNRAADSGPREPVADWARAAARWLRGSPLD
jgi:serine/threonine protein kinase